MTIQVTGVLTDSSGTPSPNTSLKFVTVQGYAGTLRTATFDDITGNDGSYDFPLATGKHVIYVKYGGRYEEIGSTIINSETPSPLSISELLKQTEPLAPDEIAIVNELLLQAQDAANRAETAAISAETDAATVQNNTDTVVASAAEVESDRQEVAANTITVQNNTDTAVAAAQSASADAILAQQWATGVSGSGVNTPSDTNNAFYFSEQAAASAITAASNAAYIQALENISGSKWTIIIDDFGNSQIVRRIPIHTFEDLNITDCPFTGPLDCFIRQDLTLRPYVDVPVYEASNSGGKAVSQAGKTPWTSINADNARARSEELSSNSVMISQEIWAMLCWSMLAGGFQPRGNTEYGRSHSNLDEFGRRSDGRVPNDRSGAAYTLTGSGPMEWSHDGTPFGVMDLVGNVWEWVDGMKMVDGQFIVAEYTGQPESEWSATGVYISETGQFTNVAPSTLNSSSQVWGSMTKASGYAGNERLQRLMIEPIACTSVLGGRFYWNLDGERFPLRGGHWFYASNAGPAALNCSNPRSDAGSSIGFRSAFVS